MNERFVKPIREAVSKWSATFNPIELSDALARSFHEEVNREVKERIRELQTERDRAVEITKSEVAKNAGFQARIIELESEMAAFKSEWLKRQAESRQRYEDLESRHNAVIRSAGVSAAGTGAR